MTEQDPARARFFALGMIRLCGVALAFLGVAILSKRWIEPAEIIGGALMAIGAFEVLVLPIILAKRWRTPKE
jgi:drug/metabolite transporter (DMT)-like permease